MSASLMDDLNIWASQTAMIEPSTFACFNFDSCNSSADKDLGGGKTCRMSYVGRHYDLPSVNERFRLVVVGIDHGEPESSSYAVCRDGIESYYTKAQNTFNPHYAGVVKTAAAVFGSSGQYCLNHCTKNCQRSCDLTLKGQCVIERIAQPNAVKCTRSGLTSRESGSSRRMWENCTIHLVAELAILKPSLVVFHGTSAEFYILNALKKAALAAKP